MNGIYTLGLPCRSTFLDWDDPCIVSTWIGINPCCSTYIVMVDPCCSIYLDWVDPCCIIMYLFGLG